MSEKFNFNINIDWEDERLPIVNGIVYPDGTIEQIEIVGNRKRKINLGGKLHINDLIQTKKLHFSEITTLCEVEDFKNEMTIYCGEGGFGGDGFVVVESKITSQIIWVAIFDDSNPFDKIEVVNDNIVAYNNLKERWTFRLDKPTELCIELIS